MNILYVNEEVIKSILIVLYGLSCFGVLIMLNVEMSMLKKMNVPIAGMRMVETVFWIAMSLIPVINTFVLFMSVKSQLRITKNPVNNEKAMSAYGIPLVQWEIEFHRSFQLLPTIAWGVDSSAWMLILPFYGTLIIEYKFGEDSE